jgi:hypothetical protein
VPNRAWIADDFFGVVIETAAGNGLPIFEGHLELFASVPCRAGGRSRDDCVHPWLERLVSAAIKEPRGDPKRADWIIYGQCLADLLGL